jgi:hypothetical protein
LSLSLLLFHYCCCRCRLPALFHLAELLRKSCLSY